MLSPKFPREKYSLDSISIVAAIPSMSSVNLFSFVIQCFSELSSISRFKFHNDLGMLSFTQDSGGDLRFSWALNTKDEDEKLILELRTAMVYYLTSYGIRSSPTVVIMKNGAASATSHKYLEADIGNNLLDPMPRTMIIDDSSSDLHMETLDLAVCKNWTLFIRQLTTPIYEKSVNASVFSYLHLRSHCSLSLF
jgi:hypothetical protein